jgi:tetratricopeptide (TPR) repeat protein
LLGAIDEIRGLATARQKAQEAQREYDSGRFADAQLQWERSRGTCADATACTAGRLRMARLADEDTLKQQDAARLDKFGGQDWAAADAGNDVEKGVTEYADAKRLLDSAVRVATAAYDREQARLNAPKVAELLGKARQLAAKERFKEAFDEVEKALVLNKNDEAAKALRAELLKSDVNGTIPLSRGIPRLRLNNVSLAQAFDAIAAAARSAGVNIVIDRKGLSDAGIVMETQGTSLDVAMPTIGQALALVEGPDLGHLVRSDGSILVSSWQSLARNLPVRRYDVKDISGSSGIQGVKSLIEMIEKTVQSRVAWESAGGRATIDVYRITLVISQTADGHKKVKQLLESLREENKTKPKSP